MMSLEFKKANEPIISHEIYFFYQPKGSTKILSFFSFSKKKQIKWWFRYSLKENHQSTMNQMNCQLVLPTVFIYHLYMYIVLCNEQVKKIIKIALANWK